jgi:acylphosphatase
MERITAIVKGRVQGVGYRYFVTGCAHRMGIHGFVRNLPDGTVQIVGESSPASLNEFVRLIRATGEPIIHVEDLVVTPGKATGEFKGFWVEW